MKESTGTDLQSAIDAVSRVMVAMPFDFVMSEACPMDELMHALATMRLVRAEMAAATADKPAE